MASCHYVYCRSPLPEAATDCPRCGFPADRSRLESPEFAATVAPEGLPERIVDMHQILPAADGIVAHQLAVMDALGIERALLQSVPEQAASLLGDAALAAAAADYPERFWASRYVDPRDPRAMQQLAAAVSSGVRVVKLLPPAGFSLDEPEFDPFWDALAQADLVAMVHTGFITARHKHEEARAGIFLSSRYANPVTLDRPARKFPRVTIILCHSGGSLWYEAAAEMATQHDNVWADVSGSGLFALERLLTARARLDWSKFFWGNDSPPWAYPINLRLLLAALDTAGARSLAPRLLVDNAARFSARHLA